jgi:hypothetical protein
VILPTKHLPLDLALLTGAATVLGAIRSPATVSTTWERVREASAITTFDRFVLSLDLLFALGLVKLESGRLARTPR